MSRKGWDHLVGQVGPRMNALYKVNQLRPWNFKWMPSENIIMVNNFQRKTDLDSYKFRVPQHMNKFEIRQYLEKLYNVEVTRVRTVNFDGRWKRQGMKYVRTQDYKVALVNIKPGATRPLPEVKAESKTAAAPEKKGWFS